MMTQLVPGIAYCKAGNVVTVAAYDYAITNSSTYIAGTLPSGYRPYVAAATAYLFGEGMSLSKAGGLEVRTNGEIRIWLGGLQVGNKTYATITYICS